MQLTHFLTYFLAKVFGLYFFVISIAMLANKILSDKSITGGECSTPGITSLISSCNNLNAKNVLELRNDSNVLIIGCEGDTDKELYNKLFLEGEKLLING